MSGKLLPRRLPLHLVRFGRRWPATVLTLAVLACVAGGFFASRVSVETDILSLVPRRNEVVREFKTTLERFGSIDLLLVVLRLEPGGDVGPAVAYADVLARELRSWELMDWVEYRLEDPATAAVPLLDRATLFLGPDEVEELLAGLDADGLEAQALRLRSQLLAPQGLVTKEYLRLDPVGFLPKILERVRLGGIGARFDAGTGCLIDPGRTCLLMLCKPVRPAQDLEFNRTLVDGLKLKLDEAGELWREEGWGEEPPRVDLAGGYVTVLEDSRLITSDAVFGLIGSLIGVMTLFLVAFRRPVALVYAFFPLLIGLALTSAFVALSLGRLNSLTSASGALLVGLGIDFIIVLYGRYIGERQAGAGHDEALEALGRHTAVGVLLGAVTTAATFFAFLITDFRGLWELGLLTGVGILLLVVAVFVVLPALLTVFQGSSPRPSGLHLRSFGSDLLCRAALHRPWVTILITAGITVVLGLAAVDLEFEDDLQNLRAKNNRGVILRQELTELFGLRFSPMMIRVDGKTEEEALAGARRLLPELEALVDGSTLAGVDTIAGILPPVHEQMEVIERLRESEIDPQALRERFETAFRRAGLNPTAFHEGVEHLIAALQVSRPLELSDLDGTALEHVVSRYLVRHDEGVSTVIYCYAPPGKWRRLAPASLVELVDSAPDAVLAGLNVVSAELRRIVWGDAGRAAALGMVIVFLLLWADLGSMSRSLLALVPLVAGMAWMLGGMALLGVQVNFFNIFVATMVIGIGVDYGVHLIHRWRESGGDPASVSETAKAIAVAALTTCVGFGSLALSHYPGLRSVGVAAILGALSTAVLSITLLPALLSRLEADKMQR